MQTRSIQFQPGTIYHVYNRGNNRQKIFLSEENYRFFLRRLHHYFSRSKIELLAYCLMPNHFHLVIRILQETDFPNVMRSFSTSYVKAFHKRYGTSGHLYQGNYQAKEFTEEGALAAVIPYVHLNPWTAGLVGRPEDWPHSDCRRWCFETNPGDSPSLGFRDTAFAKPAEYLDYLQERMNMER